MMTRLHNSISYHEPIFRIKKKKLLFWKTDPIPEKCSFSESDIISSRRVRNRILDNPSGKNYSRRQGTEYADRGLTVSILFLPRRNGLQLSGSTIILKNADMKEDELTSLRSRVTPGPLLPGGTNVVVQRLDTADPECWEFRMTVSYRLIAGMILFFGVSIMGSGFFRKDLPMCIFMILFGGMFLLVGLVTLSYGRRRACFDFGSGCCWRGKGRFHGGDMEKLPDYLPLREIAALQIIRKICRGYKGCSYCSYELNLVKNDGSRINILNHGGRKAVEEDARLLAERLKVPVWKPEPDKEAGQRQGSHKKRWGTVIIGGLFILLGIIVFCIMILSPLLLYLEARNWEKVPATVISSELIRSQSGNKTLYRIAISYRYQYNGKTCQSSRYDITRSEHSSNVGVDAMRRIVRNHPPGIQLFCWVNPDNPEQALIDRTLPNTFYLIWLWFPLPFLGLGLWAVIAGLRGR